MLATIVVPTFRRRASLARCLLALAGQRLDGGFQVIVVDDGSGDPPRPEVESAVVAGLDARLVEAPRQGAASARNVGAEQARGRVLVFTDDDCLPEPGWLAALVAAVDGREDVVAGGPTVPADPRDRYGRASERVIALSGAHYRSAAGNRGFYPTSNLAVAWAAFRRVGGFNPSLAYGEDRDFCMRLAAGGCTFVHVPDAVVLHARHGALAAFLRRHYTYGRGSRAVHDAARGRPDPAVLSSIGRAALRDPLVALSQVAMAVGYVRESLHRAARAR